MRIGEIYRYSNEKAKQNPLLEVVDGLPNYFHYTYDANSNTQVVFQKGIHGIEKIKGNNRRPAIIISSSPHKVGTIQTPWEDEFSPDYGYVRYYGDNKSYLTLPENAPGNKMLLEAYKAHSTPNKGDRENSAIPILFFNRVAYDGRPKGNLKFQGFGIIETVELITQVDSIGKYFTNFVFNFCIFSLKNEGEEFKWQWINDRRNNLLGDSDILKHAPVSWKAWLKKGSTDLSFVRRKVSSLSILKSKDQIPMKNSKQQKDLHFIYDYYKDNRHAFEMLAFKVTQFIFEESGTVFIPGWVTKKSGDGGADFVARMDVGTGFSKVKMVILGQAKCEKLNAPTNGQHIARTVARLKRGWIGVYVTTSYFSPSVQAEVIEDKYPIMMINGTKLVETVEKIVSNKGISINEYLDELEQDEYSALIRNHIPDEVLNL